MDQATFWKLIESARTGRPGNGKMFQALRRALKDLPPGEVVAFDDHFRACLDALYRWDVWGAAYVMNGGCSDDGFQYWRAMLISQGRTAYETALADPDALGELVFTGEAAEGDWEFEELLYLANEVYEAQTGDELPTRRAAPDRPAGERWDECTVADRYPRIDRRFCAS